MSKRLSKGISTVKLRSVLTTFVCIAVLAAAQPTQADDDDIYGFYSTTNGPVIPDGTTVRMFNPLPGFPSQDQPPTSPAPSVDFPGVTDASLIAPPDTYG